MHKLIGKGLVVVLSLGLVAAACSKSSTPTSGAGGGAGTETTGGTMDIMGHTVNNKGSEDVSNMDHTELEADTDDGVNYFKPTVLEGTPGEEVTLELKNESDSVTHNFSLSEQNIDVDLAPGAEKKVTVTFPDSEPLLFFCKFHEGIGMAGELKIM